MSVQMHKVDNSSQVLEFGYDYDSNNLVVKFKSGGYDYQRVPEHIYDEMCKHHRDGGSVGAFIGEHIKGRFEFVKHEQKESEQCHAERVTAK